MSEYWSGDIPWLTVVDFNNDKRFVSASEKSVSQKGLESCNAEYLYEGDLIISARGTVGALAQVSKPMTFNQSCYGLRANHEIDNGYLYYALKQAISQFKDNAGGAVFDAITIKTFDNIYIPLPPPLEQQRIERQISRYDFVELARMANIQHAFTNLFAALSMIVGRRPIGDFCLLSSKRLNPADTPEENFNYVGLEHIVEGTGEIAWTSPTKGARIKSTKNVFCKGDVLYGKLRPYLNKVWIAEFDGVCTTEMLVFKPRIPAILLKHLLLDPAFVEQANAKTGGVSLPRIKPSDMLQIAVPDVQPEIDMLTTLANDSESEKRKQQAKLDRLLAAKRAYLDKWLC